VEVTEQDLRERYESLATEELLELKARATLTDTAARLLEQVLAARSVSSEEQVRVTAEIEQRVAEQREAIASLASLGERLGAQLIDSFIAAAIVLMSFFLGIVAFPLLILGSVAAFAYLLLADGLPRGQSIGKRAVDIAVIDRQTRKPCTFIQSFLRNFLLMLLGIIDWVFIFGRTRQRLGDMAANTIVVRLKQHAAADAT
jgi:uncharacterized RDD family membrane protein YckC